MNKIGDIAKYKATYDKHKHLGHAAAELGIKWQNLYYHLSKVGHPVIGIKSNTGVLQISSHIKLRDCSKN